MNLPLGRYAIGIYVVLCAAAGLNLLFLQPISLRPKLSSTVHQDLSLTKETAAIESVKVTPLPLPYSTSQDEGNSLTKLIEKSISFPDSETLKQKDTILAIQRALESKGYLTGGSDGALTLVTQGAILAFEFDHHLPLTAEPQANLLKHILENNKKKKIIQNPYDLDISPTAEKIIRSVQETLILLGYRIGSEEGQFGERTIASIRQFEVQQGMPETGRISGELLVRLSRYKQKTSASEFR
ncbi:MAG: peptidoglycan-binding domain-containing protein [Hyphomicrobium sp.]